MLWYIDLGLGSGHTHYLLTGLGGEADLTSGNQKGNGDGLVPVRELYDYLYDKVAKQTAGKQYPQLTGSA